MWRARRSASSAVCRSVPCASHCFPRCLSLLAGAHHGFLVPPAAAPAPRLACEVAALSLLSSATQLSLSGKGLERIDHVQCFAHLVKLDLSGNRLRSLRGCEHEKAAGLKRNTTTLGAL